MSRDLGRDVPDLEKLYARKLWADFSYPKGAPMSSRQCAGQIAPGSSGIKVAGCLKSGALSRER